MGHICMAHSFALSVILLHKSNQALSHKIDMRAKGGLCFHAVSIFQCFQNLLMRIRRRRGSQLICLAAAEPYLALHILQHPA